MSHPADVSKCRSKLRYSCLQYVPITVSTPIRREYDLCVIVNDSNDMAGSKWRNVQDLLDRLSDETKFELTFVNHGVSGSIENCRDVEDVMSATVPAGGRAVLSVLDCAIMTEMDALCDVEDISTRNKRIVVILFDLPTDPAPLTLNASVDLAVKSLDSAQLPSDRISISFVHVGFSHRFRQVLKELEDDIPHRRPEYTSMARFIRYTRSMNTPTLWTILLGRNSNQLRRRSASLPMVIASPPSRGTVVRRHTTPPQDGPLLHIPGFLWDCGFRTTGTYDLRGGFTCMGWISEKYRTTARVQDFLTFLNGSSPLFRTTIGEAQGDSIGIWFLNMSCNPSAQGFPVNFWTFFVSFMTALMSNLVAWEPE